MKGLQHKYYKTKEKPGLILRTNDFNLIDRVGNLTQSPIGRTPRSNPATYTGVFDDIEIYIHKQLKLKLEVMKKVDFSFNVRGGRCEACAVTALKRYHRTFFLTSTCLVRCVVVRYNHETSG